MPPILSFLVLITALQYANRSVEFNLHAVSEVDTTPQAVILDEMRAFYRDADARNWTPLLNHFLPAKVTARWTPPVTDPKWAALVAPDPESASGMAAVCAMRATVAVVGAWARVLARRCAAPVDEAWLLRVSGRWKIVHLESLAPKEHAEIGAIVAPAAAMGTNAVPAASGDGRNPARVCFATTKCERQR